MGERGERDSERERGEEKRESEKGEEATVCHWKQNIAL